MDNYKYTLTYSNGAAKNTMEFPADITAPRLIFNLHMFLLGCSWSESQVQQILNTEEEDYE